MTSKQTWYKKKHYWLPLLCGAVLMTGVLAVATNKSSTTNKVTSETTEEVGGSNNWSSEPSQANKKEKDTTTSKKGKDDKISDVYNRFAIHDEGDIVPIAQSSLEKTEIEKVVDVIYQQEKEKDKEKEKPAIEKPSIILPIEPSEPVEPTEPTLPPVTPTEPPTEPVLPVEPPVEPEKPVEPPVEPEKPTPEEVDYRELSLLVGFVKQLNLDDYTPNSTQDLIRQLSLAQNMLSQQMGTQASVNEQVARLQSAIESLVERADFSQLEALINEVGGMDLSKFTDESVANLQSVLAEAQSVLSDKNSSQSVVSAMRARLQLAKMALKEKDYVTPLKETLQGVINQAQGINRDDYLESSLTNLDMAIAKAQAVINFSDATVEGVQSELDNLNNALNSLVARPDKSVLQDTISRAQSLSLDGYTEESIAVFNSSLAQAQEVQSQWFATQEEVDNAVASLEAAIQQLVVIEVEPQEPEEPQEAPEEVIVQEEGVN